LSQMEKMVMPPSYEGCKMFYANGKLPIIILFWYELYLKSPKVNKKILLISLRALTVKLVYPSSIPILSH